MNEGYIKLHRKIWHSWIVHKKLEWFAAWLWLLTEAAYKPTHKFINNIKIELDTGEVANTYSYFATAFNQFSENKTWTIAGVRHFFYILEKQEMIQRRSTNATTIVSICNYASYQENEPKSNRPTTNEPPKSNTQNNTHNNTHNNTPNYNENQQLEYHQQHAQQHTQQHEEQNTTPQNATTKYKRKEINNIIEESRLKDLKKLSDRLEKREAFTFLPQVIDIVDYFNQLSQKSVKYSTEQSLNIILDHLIEGRPVEMIKGVIWHKVQVYREIEKEQYISLPTILRRERFEQAFEEAKERKENLKRPKSKPTELIENREAKRLWVNGKKTDRYII